VPAKQAPNAHVMRVETLLEKDEENMLLLPEAEEFRLILKLKTSEVVGMVKGYYTVIICGMIANYAW